MFLDVLGFFKARTEEGEEVILRMGDTGKTLVRPLPEEGTELEEHVLYAGDLDESSQTAKVGEVSNIQISPQWSGNPEDLKAGDAFIFAGKDLL